ncbi:hypothetical protein [Arthrobacter sp. efr-133-R2A-120]|uniref:hypothetical protein n=1 Tax=Arthrobacter sp. efr-133-R2A-120 TaxID=3040277 RepID=UPI00254E7068|nr:hypothetical protein [Arthrobacter sp. efr-133-R2A-120]
MADHKFSGPYGPASRRRSNAEALQFGDAEHPVNPVFEDVFRVVNPEHPEWGEVTFLPGERKPQFVLEQEAAAAAAPPPEPSEPPVRRGNKSVKASD